MSEPDGGRHKVEAHVEEHAAKLQALKAEAKQALAEGRIAVHRELDHEERQAARTLPRKNILVCLQETCYS